MKYMALIADLTKAFLGRFLQITKKRLLASSCPQKTTGFRTGRIFVQFDMSFFSENLSEKFKFH